jgi:hypothetical protein
MVVSAWSSPAEFEEDRLGRLLDRGMIGEVHLSHDTLLDRLGSTIPS